MSSTRRGKVTFDFGELLHHCFDLSIEEIVANVLDTERSMLDAALRVRGVPREERERELALVTAAYDPDASAIDVDLPPAIRAWLQRRPLVWHPKPPV